MNLQMYERYVEDSNQVALVPPPGTKYDNTTKKVFIDENVGEMVYKIELTVDPPLHESESLD